MLIIISKINQFNLVQNEISQYQNIKYYFSSNIDTMIASYYQTESDLSRDEILILRNKFEKEQVDILQIGELIQRDEKSIFCFDMDSTLIKEEVIDELAREKKVYDEVAKVTKEAMEGGLDFDTALKKRCLYLDNLDDSVFHKIFLTLNLNDGVEELLATLPKRKTEIAIFSGGFNQILKLFSEKYNIPNFKANELEMKDGLTTGKIKGEIINRQMKKELLIENRNRFNIKNEYTVAVGDGSNDASMILEAGIGIGFHAKDGLKKEILNWIDFHPMTALLFLFERNF